MPQKDVKFYLAELDQASKVERKWRLRAQKVLDIFRDEPSNTDVSPNAKFNILWSNTQTQRPALYSSTPKPVVRRRYQQDDPVGKKMSSVLQRSLEYSIDSGGIYDFDRVADKLIMDYLLPGRMVARVKYHPFFQSREEERSVQSAEEIPDGSAFESVPDGGFIFKAQFDQLVSEETRTYHVPWDKFRMSPVNCWDDVWWVAFGDNFLTQDEITEQFGDEHKDVPLTHVDHREEKENESEELREIKRAQVWEIWDKQSKRVYAVVKGYDKFLMDEPDPLGLRNFFPCPEPINIVETPDKMVPIPEYTLYQDQANELNKVTARIFKLVDAMKVVGLYPGEAGEIPEMFKNADNTLIPVKDWAAITERGGLNGMIEWINIKEVVEAWQRLVIHREQLTQGIFELTGISDIQRGATDPRETKGAQQLKAGFASRRLLPKQQAVQRFFRDILRLQAEVIAEHFSPETLQQMTALPVDAEVMQALQNDKLRSFAIDVETDSTIAPDEQAEKQGASEFLTALSGFMQQSAPIVAQNPAAAKPMGEILLWMTRKFRIARDVEDEIRAFVDSTSQQQPKSDPEAEAKAAEIQANIQTKQQEVQVNAQIKAQESQAEIARKDRESQATIEREERKFALEERKAESQIRLKREEAEANVVLSATKGGSEESQGGEKSSVDINITTGESNVVPFKKGGEKPKQDISFARGEDGKIESADLGDGRIMMFARDKAGRVISATVQ